MYINVFFELIFFVGITRLELVTSEPESDVLPLILYSKKMNNNSFSAKVYKNFENSKFYPKN